ncbi:energy transducer TonB [Sphingomonas sp. IC-56]|uniref:energy transducer TonB n=1 Tax=Sphingomonas sp. IC-56 TaxID=2898529 RepID=UPI001E5157D6|nr:energy transducer TonB [Sphingomonas sp. IC-56]MCD2323603.1 energy transducer TonB [Sphingomonas sp. IC-56]
MQADRYTPPKSRTVSFGAAFLINGAIIAGLMFSAPHIGLIEPEKVLETENIPLPPVPPPEPPKPQPKLEDPVVSQAPLPYIPPPIAPQPTQPVIEGSAELPRDLPPPLPVPNPGPTTILPAETPRPVLLPLIGATQDPRYAGDFQPEYPSGELRAQRDGVVVVRIRIGTDGRVKEVHQVSATSPAFFEATRRQALSKWRFKPATRGDVPQESWKQITARFQIENL